MLWTVLLALGARADTCAAYLPGEAIGELSDTPVTESSGVVESRTRDGVWFTHNDRGDDAVIYAFDLAGKLIETHEVKGAEHEDWEDIAAAPCPRGGECLYIGDIGDNDDERPSITVYVAKEPAEGKSAKVVERWTGIYDDGPHDAEALLVNPCTGRVHIITKEGDGEAGIYRFPPFPGRETATLERIGTVVLDGLTSDSRQVTSADFDADGDRAVLRTADRIYEWQVDPASANAHWADPPIEIVGAIETQGEGITYSLNGDLVTTSEGEPMTISVVRCESLERSAHLCDFPFQGGCGCNHARAALLLPLVGLLRRRRRETPS